MMRIHSHSHSHTNGSKDKKKSPKAKPLTKLPTTVLCGFLGSGKTTLLNNILNNQSGFKVAIIVNDMSEISIDAVNVKNGQAVFKRTEEKLVEMANGCICCTLRGDLIKEVSKLARTRKFDYLLIESTGMAEPLPIAQAFSFEDDSGKTLHEIAKIDTMVTVVDAYNFYNQLNSIETHKEEIRVGKEKKIGEVPIAQLFIDQIEFANVIIINKVDLVNEEQLTSVEHIVKKLNPTAEIIRTKNSDVELGKVLNTNKFDFEEAQNTSKWIEELAKETPSSEVDEYGFSSFAFKSRKPFNPEKLFNLMKTTVFKDVVRGKGFIWLATNSVICGMLNIVGDIKTIEAQTVWWAAIKRSKWGDNKKEIEMVQKAVKPVWDPVYGDRRNELVFIGKTLNKDEIIKALNDCLITDEEFEKGDLKWEEMFNDPFVEWQAEVKRHPLRANFKERDGEWEDDDSDFDEDEEEAEEEEVKDEPSKKRKSVETNNEEIKKD